MKIIITGGAGFIGSHLCKELLKQKNQVICIDNLITGNLKNINGLRKNKNFTFIKYNICKKFSSKLKKKIGKIDWIMDLACPASPIDFPKYPFEIMDVCYIGTKNLLELAKENNAKFLQTSTSEVYGDPKEHPQKEVYWGNANCYGPRSCYDEGKRVAEALIYNYKQKYKLDTKIIRIFNTYGPNMRPDDGRVVSNFIVQAIKNEPITVYGNGKQTRSFCYISDMIEGIIKMIKSKEEGPINIGNPKEFKIIDLAKIVKKMTKSNSQIIYKNLPQDDPKLRCPNISLAKNKLKWSPKVNLEEGINKSLNYFRKAVK